MPLDSLTAWLRSVLAVAIATLAGAQPCPAQEFFNGRDLTGWEGDPKHWSVEDGEIVGRKTKIRRNLWLVSNATVGDFRLTLKVKLINDVGNSGIQFRSSYKDGTMKGYQADIGPGWWGKLYEEHGRALMSKRSGEPFIKPGDWNTYEILAVGDRVRTAINGHLCTDLVDPKGAREGIIALQLHTGFGGAVEIRFRDLELERNPRFELKTLLAQDTSNFKGAPAAPKPPKASPLSAEEQAATFSLPEGFEIELVAADPDIANVVDIAFDDAGRMWAVTAVEYPVDGNETRGAAELYKRGGGDRVVIFDTPTEPKRQKPRTFADKLAMPMTVLPYKDGAIVGHGPEVLFMRDRDGDGKADGRGEAILSGFGINDSHLMPHRFTRGPGGWIYMAQGAFNRSRVKAGDGSVTRFDFCKVGRFTLDGARFEIAGTGLNNIWGFVIDRQGGMFIQEANDLGYPVVPFYVGATYPGIGNQKARPYAPWQTPLSNFNMGGTGLSGLALSEDRNGFPPPYHQVMYVANPITRKVQAIKVRRLGTRTTLEKLPDFVNCSDPMFRPIAIHFGPDGCLYVVDWYNKIISHNEVPRRHPDRDKSHARIWRIRHRDMKRREIPNLIKAPEEDLVGHLDAESTWEARAAWHQIVDRNATSLTLQLKKIVESPKNSIEHRILALWCLEGLDRIERTTFRKLLKDTHRAIRREAVRALQGGPHALLRGMTGEPDPQVRCEIIRTLAAVENPREFIMPIAWMGRAPLDGPTIKTRQGGFAVHTGAAADRDFERSLVRAALEQRAGKLSEEKMALLPLEQRLLAGLAVNDLTAAQFLSQSLPKLKRRPTQGELALLAAHAGDPAVGRGLVGMLKDPKARTQVLNLLKSLRTRLKDPKVFEMIAATAREIGGVELIVLARTFRLRDLEGEVVDIIRKNPALAAEGLRALREMKSERVDLFHDLALTGPPGNPLQREAVAALASVGNEEAVEALIQCWGLLTRRTRAEAVDGLAASPESAEALVEAFLGDQISLDDVDLEVLEKLKTVLGETEDLKELWDVLSAKMSKVLRLEGNNNDYVDADITLEGAFTVETWVKLAPGISNRDGILGAPGSADLNFHAAKFRVYFGPSEGDVIIAKTSIEPGVWTHVAATRDDAGRLKIYFNGELDNDQHRPSKTSFKGLDIGRTIPGDKGTDGMLSEFRIWTVARSAEEIRRNHRRSFKGLKRPAGLAHYFPGEGPWGTLKGKARVTGTLDDPELMTEAEARALQEKFDKYLRLATRAGDAANGKRLFTATCAKCHKIGGTGGEIGPALDGVGLKGPKGILRAVLTPSTGVESGYRVTRIIRTNGEVLEGFLVSQDRESVVLRRVDFEDLRVPRAEIRSLRFQKKSLMPDGLLEEMKEKEVVDLLSYLRSLK